MKKFMSFIVVVSMIIVFIPGISAASPESDFEFDPATGTITKYTGPGGKVEIPSTIGGVAVTSIGSWAFAGCHGLTAIIIPNNVTSIGKLAFFGCVSLTEIIIPESITAIEDNTFSECYSLTKIIIPDSVTSIGEVAFASCFSLMEIIIPGSVISIGDRAFRSCHSLMKITILNGVTSIEDGAFANCYRLAEIKIPESVTSIGDWAFYECLEIFDIYFDSITPPTVASSAFDGVKPGARAIVPEGATEYGAEGDLWNGLIVTYFSLDGEVPTALTASYEDKLDLRAEREGNTINLFVKVLPGADINLSGFECYIVQFDDNGKLISFDCPIGAPDEDGCIKYSGTVPAENGKLFYWSETMAPVIEAIEL